MNIPPCLVGSALDRVEAPPDEASCLGCSLGTHPDEPHEGCGCPCGWTAGMRRGAMVVTVRAERPGGWWACHGRPL